MKNMTTEEWRSRILTWAALSSVFFAAGCTCVTVQVNSPSCCPSAAQQSAKPGVDRVFGGNFTPVYGPIATSSTAPPICGVSVQNKYVDLIAPVTTQKPDPANAFVGYMIRSNTTTTATANISSSDYVLRLTSGANIFVCCQIIGPNHIQGNITYPTLYYRFKAYWKTGVTPPGANEVVILYGNWTTQ